MNEEFSPYCPRCKQFQSELSKANATIFALRKTVMLYRQRILICGDRDWKDYELIRSCLAAFPNDTLIIEGAQRGADYIARRVAEDLGLQVIEFPANWNRWEKAAGPIRNKLMLDEGRPTSVIAFHDNLDKSKGTKNMVEQARKAGVPVEIKCHTSPER